MAARWPKLLARRVVAIDATGKTHQFRVHARPDGRLRIRTAGALHSKDGKLSYLLVLDPAIVFQRAVRDAPRDRGELRQIAQDLFPFPTETTRYALAGDAKGGLTCIAVPLADLEEMTANRPQPMATLIAPPEAEAIARAVVFRLDRGGVADLLETPHRIIGPAPCLTAALAAATVSAGLVIAGALSFYHSAQDRALRRELVALEAEAAPVIKQREAILRMVPALKAQAAFSAEQSASDIALLNRILSHMPSGTTIERIEIKADGLVLAGQGDDPAQWFGSAGASPKDLKIDPLPKTNHFTARFGR